MNALSFLCSSLTNSVWVYSIITKIYILLKLVGSKNQNTFSLTIIMNSPVTLERGGASERASRGDLLSKPAGGLYKDDRASCWNESSRCEEGRLHSDSVR